MERVPNRPPNEIRTLREARSKRSPRRDSLVPPEPAGKQHRGSSIVSPVLGHSIKGGGPNWGCQYRHQPAPSGPQQNEPS